MTRVPQFDLSRQTATLKSEVLVALERVVDSGAFCGGQEVAAFEGRFATYCGAKEAVGVNSGTSALHMALLAAGVQPGDEVVAPALTFAATAWAISYVGARPVFVDIDEDTFCIDPEQVKQALGPRTRAVLPVHLYGQTADVGALGELCRQQGVPLIEDAAQAQGATYEGRRSGTLGEAACFSFYPSKNLGAPGDAGCVVTNSPEVAARVRLLRDHAQNKRYHHSEVGYNYRMAGFAAAVLQVKLPHLDEWNAQRSHIATRYLDGLAGAPQLQLPVTAPGRGHVWHQFVARHPARDELRTRLDERGVSTGMHYPIPLHLQQAYAYLGHSRGAFPRAERAADQLLTLPMFPEMHPEEIEHVIEQVKGVCQELA